MASMASIGPPSSSVSTSTSSASASSTGVATTPVAATALHNATVMVGVLKTAIYTLRVLSESDQVLSSQQVLLDLNAVVSTLCLLGECELRESTAARGVLAIVGGGQTGGKKSKKKKKKKKEKMKVLTGKDFDPSALIELYSHLLVFCMRPAVFAVVMELHIATLFEAMISTPVFRQLPTKIYCWYFQKKSDPHRTQTSLMKAAKNIARFADVCLRYAVPKLTPTASAEERETAEGLIIEVLKMCSLGVCNIFTTLAQWSESIITQTIVCAAEGQKCGVLNVLKKFFEVADLRDNEGAYQLRRQLAPLCARVLTQLSDLSRIYGEGEEGALILRVCLGIPIGSSAAEIAQVFIYYLRLL